MKEVPNINEVRKVTDQIREIADSKFSKKLLEDVITEINITSNKGFYYFYCNFDLDDKYVIKKLVDAGYKLSEDPDRGTRISWEK